MLLNNLGGFRLFRFFKIFHSAGVKPKATDHVHCSKLRTCGGRDVNYSELQMILCNIQQNWEDVRFLLAYGFENLVNLYFRNLSNDKDDYHWSQCLLHLLANAIRSLATPRFIFLVGCYRRLLCKELEGEVSFRHVNAHVFILNAFGVIEKAWRNGPWMMQFDAIRPLLELFANNDSPVPIVVLLRAFWDPLATQHLLRSFELEKFQRIHDCVPLGIAMFVPTPEMLNECFAK